MDKKVKITGSAVLLAGVGLIGFYLGDTDSSKSIVAQNENPDQFLDELNIQNRDNNNLRNLVDTAHRPPSKKIAIESSSQTTRSSKQSEIASIETEAAQSQSQSGVDSTSSLSLTKVDTPRQNAPVNTPFVEADSENLLNLFNERGKQLAKQFSSENVDRTWGTAAEAEISHTAYSNPILAIENIQKLTCKTSICVLEYKNTLTSSSQRFINELGGGFSNLKRAVPTAISIATNSEEPLTVYFKRK